jgi:16S rRNA G966 N2-methylase RsmD
LIYIAPPQYKGLWAETLLALDGKGFLTEGGLAIAQIFPKEYQDLELKSLGLVDQRKYGSTMLCFYGVYRTREMPLLRPRDTGHLVGLRPANAG